MDIPYLFELFVTNLRNTGVAEFVAVLTDY